MIETEEGTDFRQKFKDIFSSPARPENGEVAEIASRADELLNEGNRLFIGRNNRENPVLPDHCIMDYGVSIRKMNIKPIFSSFIFIDPERLIEANNDEAASELVRTIWVFNQDTKGLYYRRYRSIYREALQKEEEWRHSRGLTIKDNTNDEHLKKVLGEARYFSDIGFEDWQSVVQKNAPYASKNHKNIISKIENNHNDFIVRRSYYLNGVHDYAKNHNIGYLTKWSDQKRREYVCQIIYDFCFSTSKQ